MAAGYRGGGRGWWRFGRRRVRWRGSAAGRARVGQPVGQWPAAGAAEEDGVTVACSVREGGGGGGGGRWSQGRRGGQG